jgi:iron-sulfur cluster assembly accessory protein
MNNPLSPKDIRTCIEARNLHPSMAVTITEEAVRAATTLRTDNEEFKDLSLRVYIDGKGCDGFYYGVTFDAKNDQDFVFPSNTIDMVVDPKSLYFLYGSVVDWVSDERGTGFLVNNPNHERYRGKFYKKKAWSQALVTA